MAQKKGRGTKGGSVWDHVSLPKIVGVALILVAVNSIVRAATVNTVLHHLINAGSFTHAALLDLVVAGSGLFSLIIDVGIGVLGAILIVFDTRLFLPSGRT